MPHRTQSSGLGRPTRGECSVLFRRMEAAVRVWLLVSVMLLGCAGVQRVPLRSEVLPIADGRFMGPLEIPVPRRADHQGHDFEIEVVRALLVIIAVFSSS